MLKQAVQRVFEKVSAIPRLGGALDALSLAYHRAHENCNYELARNGEAWLVRRLAGAGALATVFDVGANRGDWSGLVLEADSGATVHAFEISPPTYAHLAARFAGVSRFRPNPFGLSDSTGEIQINHCLDVDMLTSMFEVVCSQNLQITTARVRRGDEYCREQGTRRIDLLKIDVEGAEHLVLQGFGEWISPMQVPVVQFEYGRVNVLTRWLLKDFYAWFEERGYRVGKLLPRQVRFRSYRLEDEDFLGPNYVAAAPEVAAALH